MQEDFVPGTNQSTSYRKTFVLYTSAVARRKAVRTQEDIREYPSYSIDEVARYIGVPVRTLRSWVRGYSYKSGNTKKRARPIIEPADPRKNLLSFYNLVEAQVLAATREKEIPTAKIRKAIQYMREQLGDERPLLTHVFHRYGQDLFIKELSGERLNQPLNVSRFGQYGIKPVIKKYLKRIKRDESGLPITVFPLRPGVSSRNKVVSINPFVSSGKPALQDSGVMAEVIWQRKKAGESVNALASDFRVRPSEIEAAIRYCSAA